MHLPVEEPALEDSSTPLQGDQGQPGYDCLWAASLRRAGSQWGSCPQAQNELVWNLKDELKKVCSTNDLKELLLFNKQQVPSGESAVSHFK